MALKIENGSRNLHADYRERNVSLLSRAHSDTRRGEVRNRINKPRSGKEKQ